jgi:5-oxoprolinase (ATP-hydrolysing)
MPGVELYFMQSSGGLAQANAFQGKDAILSGPAGGIVGMVRTAELGIARDDGKPIQVIGFDMGGTSTDVSHYAGEFERAFETKVAGVRVRAPMMAIHTVAAGGGSILAFDGARFRVGPESAGANPGPACYRRGGPLTVTDANLALGKIQPAFFPRVFGPRGDEALDGDVVARASPRSRRDRRGDRKEDRCRGGRRRLRRHRRRQHGQRDQEDLGRARLRRHPLHAAMLRRRRRPARLPRRRRAGDGARLHPSARRRAVGLRHGPRRPDGDAPGRARAAARRRARRRRRRAWRRSPTTPWRSSSRKASRASGSSSTDASTSATKGTDSALVVAFADEAGLQAAFEAAYRQRFAFLMSERRLIVEAVSVEAVGRGRGGRRNVHDIVEPQPAPGRGDGADVRRRPLARCGARRARPGAPGQTIAGPAIVVESNATTIVEPGWTGRVTALDHLVLERTTPRAVRRAAGTSVDPILLEVFNNLFMNIAEQMGLQLQNTAYSVNIKERLDFSCALFDADGNLIANAPHMPVHLGSMSESIKTVIARNAGTMKRGDVYALNDPYHGGTHLPDVTVVTPGLPRRCERRADLLCRLSRPPRRHRRHDPGLDAAVLDPHRGGGRPVRQRQAARRRSLPRGRDEGAARERRLAVAQPGAEHRRPQGAGRGQREGRARARAMVDQYGLGVVRATCSTSRTTPRSRCAASSRGSRTAPSRCRSTTARGSASPSASMRSAQRRDRLHRHLGAAREQLQRADRGLHGCGALRLSHPGRRRDPAQRGLPEADQGDHSRGLDAQPRPPASVVAGNVETSTCITNTLYGALGVMASAQCTMNNFTFGNARHQYYETIAGGSGAGLVFDGEGQATGGFDGTSVVQTHMTNSRLTDPEVLEFRFPVRLDSFECAPARAARGAGAAATAACAGSVSSSR